MEQNKETFNWPPLEGDPEIFSNYLYKLGMSKEWKIAECFGLDEELLAFLP